MEIEETEPHYDDLEPDTAQDDLICMDRGDYNDLQDVEHGLRKQIEQAANKIVDLQKQVASAHEANMNAQMESMSLDRKVRDLQDDVMKKDIIIYNLAKALGR